MSVGSRGDRSNDYDRPQQPWVCGHLAEGTRCALGPNGRGICQSAVECVPFRQGGRWYCNRSIVRGGPCEIGPTPHGDCGCSVIPCSPRRSLRVRRRDFCVAVAALALGVACLLLATPQRNELLAPGDLSAAHAQILNVEGTERCQSCHAAASGGFSSWLRTTVVGMVSAAGNGHSIEATQTVKCLKCHQHSFPVATATLPHGVARDTLTRRTDEMRAALRQSGPSTVSPTHLTGQIACSICHREHFGRDNNLSVMTNQQCQVCHVTQYASFAQGHPDFGDWPYSKFPRIAFDHNHHQRSHFSKSGKAFACLHCHESASVGQIAAITNYESACADCHDKPLAVGLATGLPVFSLPMLDTQLLADEGLSIGEWPELAAGSFDGRLPTILRFLLLSDESLETAWQFFPPQFDWLDLDATNRQQLRATAEIAWSIKRLLHELASQGQPAVRARIEKVLGRSLSETEFQAAVAQLPWDTFAIASQQWFPHLIDEIKQRGVMEDAARADSLSASQQKVKRADDQPAEGANDRAPSLPEHDDPLAANQVPAGGWFRDPNVVGIGYRPARHEDPFLHVWIQLMAEMDQGLQVNVADARTQMTGNGVSLLRDFATSTAARECTSCHIVEHDTQSQRIARGSSGIARSDSDSSEVVSVSTSKLELLWRAVPPAKLTSEFTRFDHGPHLVLPVLSDCQACHRLLGATSPPNGPPRATVASSTDGNEPRPPFGWVDDDFEALGKASCMTCHTSTGAGDACTQCHRYHVGIRPSGSVLDGK